VVINRTDVPATAPTTRREFLSGSSVLLAGTAFAGLVSQSACSNDASAQPAANAGTPSAYGTEDLVAQPTATDFPPRSWLVASDLVTAGLASGAAVTQWADRTDNSYGVQFQETVADINGVWTHTPPTLVLNAINDLPAVSFAASQSQTMIWTPGGSLDQGLTGFSAVFVIRPDTSDIYDASYRIQSAHRGGDFHGAALRCAECPGMGDSKSAALVWTQSQCDASSQRCEFEHQLSECLDPEHAQLHRGPGQHFGNQSLDLSNRGNVLLSGISLGRSARRHRERSANQVRDTGVNFAAARVASRPLRSRRKLCGHQ
jgi:hypothetical protein